MQVGVTYSEPNQQIWLSIEVPEGSVVEEAIHRSGVLEKFPHIDLEAQKVGIFGRLVKLNAVLKAGDRVEIYRPITADPQTVPRRDTGDEE
jgi:uncharacterized protein